MGWLVGDGGKEVLIVTKSHVTDSYDFILFLLVSNDP